MRPYARDRMYSKRELGVRVLISFAALILGVGLRFHDWGLVPWLVPALMAVWAIDLAWLRGRGQIGPPDTDRSSD